MSEQQYNIIFRGDIVFGWQLSDVKLRLQQLFKADEAKVNALFTGRPVVVKRNLDLPSAEKYRAALLSVGAQADIVAVDLTAAANPAAAPLTTAASAAQTVAAAPALSAASWSLAPVGGDLLKPDERSAVVAQVIDTGSLELRPVGGNLLDSSEQRPVSQAKVAVPNFAVASLGSELLRSDEKPLEPAAVAAGNWGLAAAGADLLRADERVVTEIPAIAVPEISLAPVGSDLGQLRTSLKPVQPDISGLCLADNK